MANTPKKIKDPTEAAMSAIQDALSIRDPAPETESDESSPPETEAAAAEETQFEPPWRTVRSTPPESDAIRRGGPQARRAGAVASTRQ